MVTILWVENVFSSNYLIKNFLTSTQLIKRMFCPQTRSALAGKPSGDRGLEDRGEGAIIY
jgi:hypothetical protein